MWNIYDASKCFVHFASALKQLALFVSMLLLFRLKDFQKEFILQYVMSVPDVFNDYINPDIFAMIFKLIFHVYDD